MKIAVIGAGNMGLAFSSSFIQKRIALQTEILLVEPKEEVHKNLRQQGFEWITSNVSADISSCHLIILAVKPQDFLNLALQLKSFINPHQIVLSIMAGVEIAVISNLLGVSRVVRCMPNTPAKLGLGITGYFSQGLSSEEKGKIKELLESTGKAVEVDKETLLNAVTAISGSGPAYFYYFLKAIVDAGKEIGVPESMAKELACETMLGAYHLVKNSEVNFDELINAVASKGGTTEAALSTFNQSKVAEVIKQGVINAEARAYELSQMIGGK